LRAHLFDDVKEHNDTVVVYPFTGVCA